MENLNSQSKCPDIDELSAWFDNESDNDYSSHCQSCIDCQAIVEDFQKLEKALNKISCNIRIDPSLLAKIRQTCKDTPPTSKGIITFNTFLRLAAALAAAFILGYLYHQFNGSNETEIPIAKTDPKDNSPASDVDQQPEFIIHPLPVDIIKEDWAKEHNTMDVIDFDDIKLAGFGKYSTSRYKYVRPLVTLENRITHVWLSESVQNFVAKMINSLPKGSRVLYSYKEKQNNVYTFTLALSDKQLTELVDSLAVAGGTLLSPQEPQPENAASLLTTGKTVLYKVKVLPQ